VISLILAQDQALLPLGFSCRSYLTFHFFVPPPSCKVKLGFIFPIFSIAGTIVDQQLMCVISLIPVQDQALPAPRILLQIVSHFSFFVPPLLARLNLVLFFPIFSIAGTICRPAVDVCDIADTCTGLSSSCPSDSLVDRISLFIFLYLPINLVLFFPSIHSRHNLQVCSGSVRLAESCTGTSPYCPSDSVVNLTAVDMEAVMSDGNCNCTDGWSSPATECDFHHFCVQEWKL